VEGKGGPEDLVAVDNGVERALQSINPQPTAQLKRVRNVVCRATRAPLIEKPQPSLGVRSWQSEKLGVACLATLGVGYQGIISGGMHH
jgi:hypothetical protein